MRIFIALAALLLSSTISIAQPAQVIPCVGSSTSCVPVAPASPLPVTGSTNVPTYSAATVALANTGAGDVYCIRGSATKVVKVKGIRVSAIATTGIVGDVQIILRSTAATGGTSTAPTLVAADQQNAAATGAVAAYTVSPTPGTAIGPIRARKIAVGTQGNSVTISEGLFQFSPYWDQPIILRGITQFACVNVSAFGAGASFDIDHEQTEE
jgi:hypothetical protein